MLSGHQQEIQSDRDRKLEAAREQRKNRRQRAAGWMKRITSGWPTIRPQPKSFASHSPVCGQFRVGDNMPTNDMCSCSFTTSTSERLHRTSSIFPSTASAGHLRASTVRTPHRHPSSPDQATDRSHLDQGSPAICGLRAPWVSQRRVLLTTFFCGDRDPLRFPIDVCNRHCPERN